MYKLDHIVHFVESPEKLIEQTKNIGLYTVPGGKHDMWGTYNSLCYFGLSYIEYIGIFDEELYLDSAKEPFTLHETYLKRNRRNGFNRIALRTNSIEEDAKRLRVLGLSVFGPQNFSRTRPDGSVVKWKLLHFGFQEQDLDLPFLIEWEGEGQERYEELKQLGTIKNHPLGNLKIKEISFSVPNLKIAEKWAGLFEYKVEKSDTCMKLIAPEYELTFNKKDSSPSEISHVTISGSNEEKEIVIENGKYIFVK